MPSAAPPSVFADLRRLHPGLAPTQLRKRTLTALTHAMEDECCARAQRPWLFGAFQQERFYRQAEPRWRDFSAAARGAWVIAEFDAPDSSATPVEVGLTVTDQLRREWSLVCLTDDLPVCLAAWELPGQQQIPDPDRRFEAVWTLDPRAVADAARSFVRVLGGAGIDTEEVGSALDDQGQAGSSELVSASALFNRIVGYVDRAGDRS
jgi:DICT domain-containing protein